MRWNSTSQLLFPTAAISSIDKWGGDSNANLEPRLQSASVDQLLQLISDPAYKMTAMTLLIKKHSTTPDLAVSIWEFPNIVTILLLELVQLFKSLEPSKLTPLDSERACLVITLFQILAYHPQTKLPFIKAQLTVYLLPFISIKFKETPLENMRVTSLGVIGALLMFDDAEICYSVLGAGVVLQCLHAINYGSELAASVAVYVVLRLLKQKEGLTYFLVSLERFVALTELFEKLLERLVTETEPSLRLTKYILGCYVCLSGSPMLRHPNTSAEVINRCLPPVFKNRTFLNKLQREDSSIGVQVEALYQNLYKPRS